MKARSENEKTARYADYGGRGIVVCERWRRDFGAFLADVGPKSSPSHNLARDNNDGHYEPLNCRWATPKEQRQNQRKRARIEQFTDTELIAELTRRGRLPSEYANPVRLPQFHAEGREAALAIGR